MRILLLLVACDAGYPADDPSLALLGGDTTIFDTGDESFNYPFHNMSDAHRSLFQIGDGIFNRNWVAAPATAEGNDGLGPTYNAVSCSSCHTNNGRGAPDALGFLFRISNSDAYGDQLQDFSVLGVPAEGKPSTTYQEVAGTYGDGSAYSLRKPSYSITDLSFGDYSGPISPRLAPQVVGLGLLEAVDEQTILSFQTNGGHANHVLDVASGQMVVGRFGWKANQPSLKQQSLGAFRNDIGITNSLFPTENCPSAQTACASAPQSQTQPNLLLLFEDSIIAHSIGLAIPARRGLDDQKVLRGERLFSSAKCDSCHIPEMTTGDLADWPEASRQKIRPFTDLLLHDMGPDLADDRPDFEAGGSEWRTPPLWGLGLVQPIEGSIYLLHDGRARDFAEAILWHGGQAMDARENFRRLSKDDRDALLAFLGAL